MISPYRAAYGIAEASRAILTGFKTTFYGMHIASKALQKSTPKTFTETLDLISKAAKEGIEASYAPGSKAMKTIEKRGIDLWSGAQRDWAKVMGGKSMDAAMRKKFKEGSVVDMAMAGEGDLYSALRGMFKTRSEAALGQRIKDVARASKLTKGETVILKKGVRSLLDDKTLYIGGKQGSEYRRTFGKVVKHYNRQPRKAMQNLFMKSYVDTHKRMAQAAQKISTLGLGIAGVGGTINVASDLLQLRSPIRDRYGRLDIPYIPGI